MIYLILAALGLYCFMSLLKMQCVDFSLQCLFLFQRMGSRVHVSVVVAHGLICPSACGILQDQ